MAYAGDNRLIANRGSQAYDLAAGRTYGSVVSVTGIDKIQRRLEGLALWSQEAENQLLSINKRVGKVYLNYLNANIKDFDRDIRVQFKDREDIIVKRGQLRRSLGLYQPLRGRGGLGVTRILAGPLTNNFGNKGARGTMLHGKRGVTKNADGWFAHIVEGGDSFGIKKRTANTGVFMRGKAATQERAMRLRDRLLRKEFSRYLNTLLRA
jgi:hypothetical protein